MKKAAEIREQNSTENEVEKARAMFDDAILLDDEPDDKSDDKPDDKPKKEPDLSYLDEIDLDDEEYEDEEESDCIIMGSYSVLYTGSGLRQEEYISRWYIYGRFQYRQQYAILMRIKI